MDMGVMMRVIITLVSTHSSVLYSESVDCLSTV